jgi:hypothetical protein
VTPHERLRHDLLIDCAAELDTRRREIEDLKLDNAMLLLQVRILWCRLKKLKSAEHAR